MWFGMGGVVVGVEVHTSPRSRSFTGVAGGLRYGSALSGLVIESWLQAGCGEASGTPKKDFDYKP